MENAEAGISVNGGLSIGTITSCVITLSVISFFVITSFVITSFVITSFVNVPRGTFCTKLVMAGTKSSRT